TFERFHDPVIAGNGHIYERTEIIRWIREKGTSLLIREPFRLADIRKDEAICEAITRHYADINHELSRISTIEQNIPLPTPIVPNHRFLPIQSYNPIPRRNF
ncbi:unnamed protein product, partial [Rotaria sordida]